MGILTSPPSTGGWACDLIEADLIDLMGMVAAADQLLEDLVNPYAPVGLCVCLVSKDS
jgi:hypothetical protein